MTYPLTICNGYAVVNIDGNKYMLDTGSPVSMSTQMGLRSVSINGLSCPLMYNPIGEQLRLATGLNLVGLLGTDVIGRFGGVLCDKVQNTATFGEVSRKDGIVVPFEKRGDYHFHARVNGRNVLGYLDVGAPRPMIDDHSLLDLSRDEGDTDEPSMRGTIHTRQFGGEIEFGGVTRTVHMLRSVRDMNRDGISQVYFGLAAFAEEYFAIDVRSQTIRFR